MGQAALPMLVLALLFRGHVGGLLVPGAVASAGPLGAAFVFLARRLCLGPLTLLEPLGI